VKRTKFCDTNYEIFYAFDDKSTLREFQSSTWADSSNFISPMSMSQTSLTSWGLVPKYAGTHQVSQFSCSQRNMPSARIYTRIDLQQHQQQHILDEKAK